MIHSITPSELKELMDHHKAILVDVREPSEYAAEHIPGSILHPTSTLDIDALPTEPIVVFHCRSGMRSLQAATRYSMHHLKDGYHLEGGLVAWKKAGFHIIRA